MIKLVTTTEMRTIENEANAHGWSFDRMVEQAGWGLAQAVFRKIPGARTVLGLVGSGNNGADTLVALSELGRLGMQPAAYLARARPADDPLVLRIKDAGYAVVSADEDAEFTILERMVSDSEVLLDGILGTGFVLPLKPELARLMVVVRNQLGRQKVVAVDCPSGVDCSSGEAAPECLKADFTVCMAAVKTGLLRFPAFALGGDLLTAGIGLPEDLPTWQQLKAGVADADWVACQLPERPLDSHKGTFGTVTVAAGSVNYTGAAYLAGKSAYRIGAGLVQMAVPGPLHAVLAGQLPEATWVLLPHDAGVIRDDACDVLLQNLGKTSSLLLGPGWGLEDTTGAFLTRILNNVIGHSSRSGIGFVGAGQTNPDRAHLSLPPLVIDADGLKLLARNPEWVRLLPEQTILTPHAGEMAILTGLKIEQIQQDRLATAQKFAEMWGQVVVLKGALTVVASPDGRVGVVPVASSGLAKAGTGDVLAGMITGLRAQGLGAFEAALAGSWIHAHAGLAAVRRIGHSAAVLASDVLDSIPLVLNELEKQ